MEVYENLSNIEAEQSVLGAILIDNTLLSEITLSPECFYREAHRVIFWAMAELYCENSTVDLITITERLKGSGKLEAIGGLEYLMHLQNSTITTQGCKSHADIVKECYRKRMLLRYLEESKLAITANDDTSVDAIHELQKNLDEITNENVSDDNTEDITKSLDRALGDIERRMEGEESGLQTYFLDFDRQIGGFFPSDLDILAARPGMGKTALALNIAKNVVYKENGVVLFISLEMSKEQIQYRLLSSLSGVELTKFRTPSNITPEELNALRRASRAQSKGILEVSAGLQMTVEDILHRARKCQHEHGLDLVVVDYLQLIVDKDSKGDRVREITRISRGLKALAMELSVPVLALSQLNRGLEARNDKRPMLSDLRESGSIEQDADMVMFVYRDTYYNPDSENKHSELIIAKNRHGARTVIPLFFQAKTATFLNLCKER